MELRNHTPFVPFPFVSRDKDDRAFDVVLVKGTYDLVDDRRLKISQDQAPICVKDEFHGDVNVTSVSRESDLHPFKPRADVVVVGDSHAPSGRAAQSWFAEVRLGDMHKAVRVHGPRYWRRSMKLLWSLSDPEPAVRVPVRYEHAFGGTMQRDEELLAFERNPVGVGFAPKRVPSDVSEMPAPQIEDPADPISEFGREHAPAGFSWIGRAWQPRLALAGTFDDAWKATKWPLMPDDWDDAFNNGAHPELTYPGYLSGGEPFRAMNMTESGSASFEVPRHEVDVRLRYQSGVIETFPTVIDTLLVDFTESKVFVSYRARIPQAGPLRVIETCMRMGS